MVSRRNMLGGVLGLLAIPKFLRAKELEGATNGSKYYLRPVVDEWWEIAKLFIDNAYKRWPNRQHDFKLVYINQHDSSHFYIWSQFIFGLGSSRNLSKEVFPTEAEFNELKRRIDEYRPA